MLEIYLPVKPIPKGRPRFVAKGNIYTPKRTMKAQNDIKMLVKAEMNKKGIEMITGSVSVHAYFCYSPQRMGRRPDIDNTAKLILDSLNDLIYKDDSQVQELYCMNVSKPENGIYLIVKEL